MGFIWADDKEDDQKFKDHVAGLLTSLTASKEGLQADITRIKAELKKYEGIDVEALKSDSAKYKELLAEKNKGETDEQKALRISKEQLETKLKTVEAKLEKLLTNNEKLLVDDSLKTALISANVKKEMIPAAVKVIKPDVSILEVDGESVAKVGDKTIDEYVKEWATTDIGKHFIEAKRNSGGGGGGGGDTIPENEAEKYYDKKSKFFNRTKQLQISRTNADLHKRLVEKYS